MVQLTQLLRKYMPYWLPRGDHDYNSDKRFLKKVSMFQLTRFYPQRARNCYKLARRMHLKQTKISMRDRADKGDELRDLWSQRLWAACDEHRLPYKYFLGILPQMGIELDRKALSSLAIFEPRTFASLVHLCKAKVAAEPKGEAAAQLESPPGVITRGML
jgi:large subunit ribosomal protein L20